MTHSTPHNYIPIEEVPTRTVASPMKTPLPNEKQLTAPKTAQTTPRLTISKPKASASKGPILLKLHAKLLVTTYGIAKLNNTSVEKYIQQAIRKENERQLKKATE